MFGLNTSATPPSEFAARQGALMQLALAATNRPLAAYQATLALGVLPVVHLVSAPSRVVGFRAKLTESGTAGTAVIKVRKIPKGSATPVDVCSISIAFGDGDGTNKTTADLSTTTAPGLLAEGDAVILEVTGVGTGMLGLIASADIDVLAP